METLLKKPEIFWDSMGRFDRHGKTLAKTQKIKWLDKEKGRWRKSSSETARWQIQAWGRSTWSRSSKGIAK